MSGVAAGMQLKSEQSTDGLRMPLQSNLPGMCISIYMIGLHSSLPDDVALQQKLSMIQLFFRTTLCRINGLTM